MYHRLYPITPSQQAINGALDLFVDGGRKDDVRQQLVGLSVLQSATADQVEAAMPVIQARWGVTRAEIGALFAR